MAEITRRSMVAGVTFAATALMSGSFGAVAFAEGATAAGVQASAEEPQRGKNLAADGVSGATALSFGESNL